MADFATVEALLEYYTNLLIIQYNQKPKARAHIRLLATQMMMNGVMLDVLNGYAIESAVGKQLDVIGKYVGVDRFYEEIDLENYFAFTFYDEVSPDTKPKYGFSNYANFEDFAHNGTLTYDAIITESNALGDPDFRLLIRLAILLNSCQHGHGEIDQKIFALFGDVIRMESAGLMHMAYFLNSAITPFWQAVFQKRLLPKPEGVALVYVQQNNGDFFAFADYSGNLPPFGGGFTNYTDYDTEAGQILKYDLITGY